MRVRGIGDTLGLGVDCTVDLVDLVVVVVDLGTSTSTRLDFSFSFSLFLS